MEDEVMIDSWADAVEEELSQKQNLAQPPSDKDEEIAPDSPTDPSHENKNEEDADYEQIAGSVGNLTVHSPAPVVPDVTTLASDMKAEPRSLKETEATNFVPGHIIRFLPEKLRIRINPSRGWVLTSSETPPAPPRFVKPQYSAMKVGMSVDGYDPDSSRTNSKQMEGSYTPNVPVFLTISDPYRIPFYRDFLNRVIPTEYIYFDQRFREMTDRKPVYDSLLHKRDASLKQAEVAHCVQLQQWRITRRFMEQDLVEAEWENKNFSIFHPGVTGEDLHESRRYIRAQNQLDREGKIHKWFNGDPSSLIIPENKEHQRYHDTNDEDVEMTSKPAENFVSTYAEALTRGTPGPGKLELDGERKWKLEERKKEKLERRKERLSLKTNQEVREARKKAIVSKRDKGVLPPRPCPKCLKPGHWRIDCPELKTKVSKSSKKVHVSPQAYIQTTANTNPSRGEKRGERI